MEAKDRIILALDVDTQEQALNLVKMLTPYVGAFKVGMQLYNSCGPSIVNRINDLGGRVFVDLKLHDIPNTVAAAGRVLTRLNCFMFNVHAAGGREMMSRLADEVSDEAARMGIEAPLILAVTVLTSISQRELEEEMLISGMEIRELVVRWAVMARQSGISGVVCSPQEIGYIRSVCGPGFVIVTPGIRPSWSEKDDQKRITTPRQALEMGADYMVIGRPITKADNPVEAAQKIIAELEEV
ncbi:MAG: orotidine-5'-phosphate decarboxylase [Syntrophomonadaceae bacterium]|nr:orotidine-5'-phosphate decarboxylase [Syntrophomonadaceae bacterium]MDD3023354.1 orotidine-5'-phosphate decarboxylase [Syntrophomonadaceae bacterium]